MGDRLIPAHAGKTLVIGGHIIDRRAHPRSRGENAPPFPPLLRDGGSSPLTRGKRPGSAWAGVGWGLIPAHAGKTCDAWRRVRQGRAHPRSRGENMTNFAPPEDPEGSSPLTRGKPSARASSSTTWRLIPAHAGKTSRTCAWCQPPWAHPRSRGENRGSYGRGQQAPGASPLTRGKLISRDRETPDRGRIPAHAGKTA